MIENIVCLSTFCYVISITGGICLELVLESLGNI